MPQERQDAGVSSRVSTVPLGGTAAPSRGLLRGGPSGEKASLPGLLTDTARGSETGPGLRHLALAASWANHVILWTSVSLSLAEGLCPRWSFQEALPN